MKLKPKKLVGLLVVLALLLGAGLAQAQCYYEANPLVLPLKAGVGKGGGEGTVIGTVTVWQDPTTDPATFGNLYVRYDVDTVNFPDLTLTATQVAICTSPFTSRPAPGQSGYVEDGVNVTSKLWTIPLNNVLLHSACATSSPFAASCADELWIATHAADSTGETSYAGSCVIPSTGSWYCQFSFEICCGSEPPPPPSTCGETAWAYGGDPNDCFIGMTGITDNKWGWTNGLLATPGIYTFDLYAGAGQCDITKGTKVGTVTVDYNGTLAKVTYNVTGINPTTKVAYKLSEAHLWVGCDKLPKITVGKTTKYTTAPGQFPGTPVISGDGKSAYLEVTLDPVCASGIYVAAHAVVDGFPCPTLKTTTPPGKGKTMQLEPAAAPKTKGLKTN